MGIGIILLVAIETTNAWMGADKIDLNMFTEYVPYMDNLWLLAAE